MAILPARGGARPQVDVRACRSLRSRPGAAAVIAILGGGVAGAALAWALTGRGRKDVVVFDLLPPGSGSTTKAFGGFRTQQGSPINVTLSLASRPFFAERAGRVRFRTVGYLYLA